MNTDSSSISTSSISALISVILIPLIIITVLMVIAQWKIFVKAGKPGWASIVPVYNTWITFEIVGYQGWWSILSLIPFVNFFVTILVLISYFKIAKAFGKSDLFGVLNVLFPYVGLLILGFGKAQFVGLGNTTAPVASAPVRQAPTPPTIPTV